MEILKTDFVDDSSAAGARAEPWHLVGIHHYYHSSDPPKIAATLFANCCSLRMIAVMHLKVGNPHLRRWAPFQNRLFEAGRIAALVGIWKYKEVMRGAS